MARLRFTDIMTLFSKSGEDLHTMVLELHRDSAVVGWKVNKKKLKVIFSIQTVWHPFSQGTDGIVPEKVLSGTRCQC